MLTRIGEEISEQLDSQPAKVRVIRNIRPKYACACCKSGVAIAPVPAQLLPKSLATPSLLAQITTAKFVDGTPLYRQEPQMARMGVPLGRATMAGWMIQLGGVHVVPIVNLMHEVMLSDPLIHCDETRLQVLKSNKAPTADHWMWVRASGPPGRRITMLRELASCRCGCLRAIGASCLPMAMKPMSALHRHCNSPMPAASRTCVASSMRRERHRVSTRATVTPRSPCSSSASCI